MTVLAQQVRYPRASPAGTRRAADFFARNAFFRTDEFATAYVAGGHSRSSVAKVLDHSVRTGLITQLRRGLYATCSGEWNPWLLATKLAPNALLAYDGALSFHDVAGVEFSCAIAAAKSGPRFTWNETIFDIAKHPLPAESALDRTSEHQRGGHTFRVTNLGRTLVDCLDRVDLGRPLDELFEHFALQPKLDIDFDDVVAQVEALGSATVAARVCVFLWAHPVWRNRAQVQSRITHLLPKRTVYADPSRPRDGKYISRFNIIVPEELAAVLAHYP